MVSDSLGAKPSTVTVTWPFAVAVAALSVRGPGRFAARPPPMASVVAKSPADRTSAARLNALTSWVM